MKQVDQLQPWTLCFRARAKRFDFKFKFSKFVPICKIFRISIRFKLRPFTFEFQSKPRSAFSLKRKLADLKFLHRFKCLLHRRSGNKGILESWVARKNYWCGRGKNRVWFWVVCCVVLVGCFVIVQLLRSYYRTRIIWKFFWMVWNQAAPSEFLHHIFKVIFDGLSRYLGF